MAGTVTGLEERLSEVVGTLNVLHAELVAIVADVAERRLWADYDGVRSLSHWLCWQLGCSPATARDLIRLADARTTHPAVTQQMTDGAITLDQAAAAVRARPECDAVMANLAPLSTVTQIRLEVRTANAGTGPPPPPDGDIETEAPSERRPSESMSFGRTDDDQWWLSARLDPERGELVEQALREARDRLFRGGRTDVTWADALIDVARRSLEQAPAHRRDLYRVNLFVARDGASTLTDRVHLPDAIARQLTCDGSASVILTDFGIPVSVGHTRRIVPEATRRVVLHRDGGRCRNPACGSRFGLEMHHIIHWRDGGTTDTHNVVGICDGCHELHHRGLLGITGNADLPDGVVFTDRHGTPLTRPRPNPPPTRPAPPDQRYRHPLGQRLVADAMVGIFPEPLHPN